MNGEERTCDLCGHPNCATRLVTVGVLEIEKRYVCDDCTLEMAWEDSCDEEEWR